jgi:hypothetical protein
MSYAQICIDPQIEIKKSMLTIMPAFVIRIPNKGISEYTGDDSCDHKRNGQVYDGVPIHTFTACWREPGSIRL